MLHIFLVLAHNITYYFGAQNTQKVTDIKINSLIKESFLLLRMPAVFTTPKPFYK